MIDVFTKTTRVFYSDIQGYYKGPRDKGASARNMCFTTV